MIKMDINIFVFISLCLIIVPYPITGHVLGVDNSSAVSGSSVIDNIKNIYRLLADEKNQRLRQNIEIDRQKKEIEQQKNEIALLQNKNDWQQNNSVWQQNEIDRISALHQYFKDQLANIGRASQEPIVAFRTQLMHDLGDVHEGFVIIFDRVDLNLGNAYDVRHGIFTAPYHGTYVFSLHLGNSGSRYGQFFLKSNNQYIEFVFTGHNGDWELGSVSTVALLNAGDDVWVEGAGIIQGGNGNHLHTGFSGFLLHTI